MISIFVVGCVAFTAPTFNRRDSIVSGVAAATVLPPLTLLQPRAAHAQPSSMRVTWGPFQDLSPDDMDRLSEESMKADAGELLASGVRVIDLVEGSGPALSKGTRAYAHYKMWAGGFRSGPVADYSFQDNRPYDWLVGEPTDRIPAGVDEGILGMREGGWRRLVVPAAFGDVGLRRINYGPTGRYVGAKAPYVLKPGATAYVDLLLDGGSGRCDTLLRPPDLSERDARKIRSLLCQYAEQIY